MCLLNAESITFNAIDGTVNDWNWHRSLSGSVQVVILGEIARWIQNTHGGLSHNFGRNVTAKTTFWAVVYQLQTIQKCKKVSSLVIYGPFVTDKLYLVGFYLSESLPPDRHFTKARVEIRCLHSGKGFPLQANPVSFLHKNVNFTKAPFCRPSIPSKGFTQ